MAIAPITRNLASGQLTPAEARFCRAVKALSEAGAAGRCSFDRVIDALLVDLLNLRRHDYDADALLEKTPLLMEVSATQLATSPQSVEPTEHERAFLNDLAGMVDFAVRNGLDFMNVITALNHDVGEIRAHGDSLEATLNDCVRPWVSGWAGRNADLVGEGED